MKNILFILFFLSSNLFATTYYWVGGTGNWNDPTNHWSTSSGGSGGAGNTPTATDDVVFDALSNTTNYTVTVNAAAVCKAFTMGAPLTNKVTWAGSSSLAISDSIALTGGTAGITRTYTGVITFNATSGTKTITLNGVTMNSDFTFDGVGGAWKFMDAFNTSAKTITVTNGSLDINAQTVTAGVLSSNNSNTRTITCGNATITLSSPGSITFTTSTNLTFTANGSTINLSSGTATLHGGGMTFNIVNFTGITSNASVSVFEANTFANLTFTGSNTKTSNVIFGGNQTISTLLTINGGNQTYNRLFIKSDVLGTQRTLTSASNTITRADFQDIVGAGAGSWNLASILGNSGDALGNSGITFTTPVKRYAKTATSKSWSDSTMWSATSGGSTGASFPLPQDTVYFDASSITAGSLTITCDMPRMGSDISFSGVTNTPAIAFSSTTNTIFGSLTLATITISGTNATTLASRSSETLTSAGVTFTQAISILAPSGTYTLQDSLKTNSNLTLTNGGFDANNFNVNCLLFSSSNSNTRSLTMGSGRWILSSASSAPTIWTLTTTTGLTFNANASTIYKVGTNSTSATFAGGGLTYNNITFDACTPNYIIQGSNTFNAFTDYCTSTAHSITFTTGTTQTVTTFTVSGTVGNLITINSTTTGTHALVKSGGGTISCDYLSIQHSVATPTCTWFAGTHSTNNNSGGGCTVTCGSGWTFTAPASCTTIKTRNGVAYANLKTVNGTAIANVKTINAIP